MDQTKLYTINEIRKLRWGDESAPTSFTVRAWMTTGIRGRRLKRVKVGKQFYTTLEWLDSFLLGDEPSVKSTKIKPKNAYSDVAGFFADQKAKRR